MRQGLLWTAAGLLAGVAVGVLSAGDAGPIEAVDLLVVVVGLVVWLVLVVVLSVVMLLLAGCRINAVSIGSGPALVDSVGPRRFLVRLVPVGYRVWWWSPDRARSRQRATSQLVVPLLAAGIVSLVALVVVPERPWSLVLGGLALAALAIQDTVGRVWTQGQLPMLWDGRMTEDTSLAWNLFFSGRVDEASSVLRARLERRPGDALARKFLCDIASMSGDDTAYEELAAGFDGSDLDPVLLANDRLSVLSVRAERGDPAAWLSEGSALAARVAPEAGDNPLYADTLALHAALLGDYVAAHAWLERADRLPRAAAPQRSEVEATRARVLAARGDLKAARRAVHRARRLNPDNPRLDVVERLVERTATASA